VQQEILLPLDQRQNLVEIPAPQRRQTVVQIGPNRAFGVEEAHGVGREWDDGVSIASSLWEA